MLPRSSTGWRTAAHQAHRDAAAVNAARRGMLVDTYVTAAEQWLRARLATAEVRLRIRHPHVLDLLRDGRYLTQFEVPHSGGALGQSRRMVIEHTVLGVPPSCRPSDRPVYGYLSGSDEAGMLGQYGDVVVRLKRSVRPRSRFVIGDSLDHTITHASPPVFAPEPVDRPSLLALIAPIDPLDCPSLADASPLPYRYAEAQIYGGVRLSDVEEFVFTLGTRPDANTQNLLKRHRIAWQSV